jgi:hypothetical protein
LLAEEAVSMQHVYTHNIRKSRYHCNEQLQTLVSQHPYTSKQEKNLFKRNREKQKHGEKHKKKIEKQQQNLLKRNRQKQTTKRKRNREKQKHSCPDVHDFTKWVGQIVRLFMYSF